MKKPDRMCLDVELNTDTLVKQIEALTTFGDQMAALLHGLQDATRAANDALKTFGVVAGNLQVKVVHKRKRRPAAKKRRKAKV